MTYIYDMAHVHDVLTRRIRTRDTTPSYVQHVHMLWHLAFVCATRLIQICNIIQPNAIGVSLNLNLQSQSHWSLFYGTWQRRPRERDKRFRSENEEMPLQMQSAVHVHE
jgi:hypothetical protein